MTPTIRFRFGRNWLSFISLLTEDKIAEADRSLLERIKRSNLHGLRFLDIGSGSGLFSLSARRQGAEVYSFDFDHDSVACTAALKERYFPNDPSWQISQGSVLDREFLQNLQGFDIVYSWGVLHHTGRMWEALANAIIPLNPNGLLFISIYNDQGPQSRFWSVFKSFFCRLPRLAQLSFGLPLAGGLEVVRWLMQAIRLRPKYQPERGMDRWHDWIDWFGGYPFEVATPQSINEFYESRGFVKISERLVGSGWGCNEYVFQREHL